MFQIIKPKINRSKLKFSENRCKIFLYLEQNKLSKLLKSLFVSKSFLSSIQNQI